MKKFPIKYNASINIMLAIISAIACFLIVFNIIRMYDSGFNSRIVAASITFIIFSSILAVFIISIAFFSSYKLNHEYLYIKIGFFKFKLELKMIDKIIIYKENKESFIFYTKKENKKTHLICMEFNKQHKFIDEILKFNKNIIFITQDFNNL